MIILGLVYLFVAIYAMQVQQLQSYLKQPPTVNCDRLIEVYGRENLETLAVMESLDARKEFNEDRLQVDINGKISQTGAQACYC